MKLNDFIDKHGKLTAIFKKDIDDEEYDFQVDFIADVPDSDNDCGVSITYKRDDEFSIDELFEKVLDKFEEYINEEKKEEHDNEPDTSDKN